MVVQHNMQAANANRMLNVTTGQQAKSTEKLSSGYRINRAADDAAGLTISEKMRSRVLTELQQMQRMAFQQYRQQKVPSQRFTQCSSV
jgi:flagellin-like hook-associated protein FlgL